MRNKSVLFPALSSVVALCLTAPILTSAQTNNVRPRITAAVDNLSRVAIPRSRHPLAQSAFDTGALDGATELKHIIMVLGASPDQDEQLRTLLDSQQTQGSPDYHRWLTPDEFGQRFGASPQDIQTVTAWLQRQGFSVESVARGGRWIEFSGTSAQVESAFQTQMRHFQVAGEAHVANASDISIPAALAPVVRGVVSLHNFQSKSMLAQSTLVRRTAPGKYEAVNTDHNLTGGGHALAPGDFAKIYNLNPLYSAGTPLNGNGQTIAVVARSEISLQDIADFRTVFGLPSNTPNLIVTGEDPGDVSGDDVETTLDTEWSGAVAPGATIDVVISGSTLATDGVDLSAFYIVDQNLAPVMSTSFSQCEQFLGSSENGFWAALWQQAAAQGISAFVASGDSGAAGCDRPLPSGGAVAANGFAISGLASTPFNTAVGGTQFNETGNGTNDATFWTGDGADFVSVLGYIPEKIWNESCDSKAVNSTCPTQASLFSGGGGVSILYPTPSYQTLSVTGLQAALNAFTLPAPNQSLHPRGIPDVSLTAAGHDGYLLCFQASCEPTNNPPLNLRVEGTSASSPAFAGIMAIVDQKIGARQGLANYVLYSLAAAENFGTCNSNSRTNPANSTACVFNDVTTGTNGVPGNDVTNVPTNGALGFPATTGFDLASGLGSVDAFNLVNAWATAAGLFQSSKTTLTSSIGPPINITHGQSVTLTVNVTKNPTGSGPAGDIAIETDQPGATPGSALTVIAGTLVSGSISGGVNNLPGGSYNVFANYPGDGTFAGSSSAKLAVNVAKEASAIQILAATPTSTNFITTDFAASYGTPLAFNGFVFGASGVGNGTGTLTFSDTFSASTTNIGPALNLNSAGGAETFVCSGTSSNCFAIGAHTVNATYDGSSDLSFNSGSTPSAGASITVTVNQAPTATSVSPSSTTVVSGGSVVLTAAVLTQSDGVAPTGPTTVQFLNNGVVIATVPVPVTRTPGSPKYPYWLLASAILLFLAYAAMSRPRKRRGYVYSGLALVALLVTVLSACGGGSGGGGGGGGGSAQIGAVSLITSQDGTATTPAFIRVSATLSTTFSPGTHLVITANYPGDTNYAATSLANRTSVTITVQ